MNEYKHDIVLVQEPGMLCDEWLLEASMPVQRFGHPNPSVDTARVPCILVKRRLSPQVVWARSTNNACYLMMKSCDAPSAKHVLYVSVYLPDSTKEAAVFQNALGAVEHDLDDIWGSSPWDVLVFGGDLNIQVPVTDLTGQAATGAVWDGRASLVYEFTLKWNLSWAHCLQHTSYTHRAFNGGAVSVLDYILTACVAGVSCAASFAPTDCHEVCSPASAS
jgi:hypothetical protein